MEFLSAHQGSSRMNDSTLARLSPIGRHIVAATSGHWVQFDDPNLVVALECLSL
jgi:hypothetical protein